MPPDQRSSARKPGLSIGAVVLVIAAVVLALRNQQIATSPPAPPAALEPTGTVERAADVPRPPPPPSVAAATKSPAPAAVDAPETLRIGSWNIEWLGRPDDRSGQGRGVAQSTDDLADYIDVAKVSVLALQEIVPDTSGDSPRSDELDAALAVVSRESGGDWQYMLFPGRSETDQLCGVAWDDRVVTPQPIKGATAGGGRALRLPLAAGRSSQGSTLWHRAPHLVRFAGRVPGRTDFAVIVVHMKADYQGDFAAHRGEEAARLVDKLPGVAESLSERDLIVIGDTNMTAAGEPAAKALEAAGFRDLNAKQETTHWRGGATDRAFVPRDQPEFAGSRFEVMSDRYLEPRRWEPRDFKRRLSDHYLIVTTLRMMPDDD